jgi:hypothetical protein
VFVDTLAGQLGSLPDPDDILEQCKALDTSLIGLDDALKKAKASKALRTFLEAPVLEVDADTEEDADETVAEAQVWPLLEAWALLKPLHRAMHPGGNGGAWLDDWLLTDHVAQAFGELGREPWEAYEDAMLLGILLRHVPSLEGSARLDERAPLQELLSDPQVQRYVGMNHHDGVDYIVKERLDALLFWRLRSFAAGMFAEDGPTKKLRLSVLKEQFAWTQNVLDAAESAGYDVRALLDQLD